MTTTLVILLAAGCMIAGIAAAILLIHPRLRYLHRRLMTDHNTGLMNYEGFLHYLKKHQKRESFVLFLLDLDDFRRFNRQGYDTGDEVLKLFAAKLSKAMSGHAVCARYRLGDEFLVIVREKDSHKISEILEKLNQQVNYKNDSVHFSCGIAVIEGSDTDCFAALRNAHEILMSKKK
ncbi:MAG: hypothetical protein A2W93_16050 [Bacteroidetes bacterium GWF2_43_63]|nr:MAG: hypothetical protein A2W94_11045 [Bacteroidetes bacterium GWE2_42_42]OFY54240.1 MAG: hypothetical protein A2W93_16050 [Bacteroidetes bacterium GWF2_43_63]HBG69370.1 hypothetical protein [Bacteroidales bacterium]HCB60423.1 hypothetical protein [Bacteroidales bacterium]HCY23591.1 hypothetical protein [Bacteroidales bacterium]